MIIHFVVMFSLMALMAVNLYIGMAFDEGSESMFSTSVWTTNVWFGYLFLGTVMLIALNGVFALVFGFLGVYACLMLRKPKKALK